MNPTVGGTTTGHRTGLQQAVDAAPQRLSAAQHAKEDQPSPEMHRLHAKTNDIQATEHAMPGSFMQASPMTAVALFQVVFKIC